MKRFGTEQSPLNEETLNKRLPGFQKPWKALTQKESISVPSFFGALLRATRELKGVLERKAIISWCDALCRFPFSLQTPGDGRDPPRRKQ